ncbi:ABC transporter permease subunit [Aestuariivirga sp.]|uniref:ABC transporter permease subunit n=1 Tax=Aestuariivirga sp. TaxID=2650926 RepID=UPI0025B835D3|nr:ABC transporter permease subunit [Aestuariivirga sp.]MCA3555627.1 ABC transporter permease subunit [Aestuariivirga sp.]
MIERTPILNAVTQVILAVMLFVILIPFWMVFAAASHDFVTVNRVPMPLWPGGHLYENLAEVWVKGNFGTALVNSFISSVLVTVGKVFLASITAFSIVFFRYRARMLVFWAIFVTLMLPLEVRIVPTYAVAANVLTPFQQILDFAHIRVVLPEWNLLNTYPGLVLPLVATATGTFLYRQFYMTVPNELAEAAKMDGAGPLRFYWQILMPLSRSNMAALAAIMFVYAWNQYLWPLLVITDQQHFATATMQLQKMVPEGFGEPPVWNTAMAANLIVLLPPAIVSILLQRLIVRGLIVTEK